MKKVFTRGGGSVSLVLLVVILGGAQAIAQTQQPAIPSTFFGIHVNNPTITTGETSYPVQVTYGNFRNWDVYQVSWPDIELCEAATGSPGDKCFHQNHNASLPSNFIPLTTELQDLNSASVGNVMLTLSRTPWWAVTTAQWGDTNCNYYDPNHPQQYGGACYAPNGPSGENHLNQDGTGDDLIWRNWVTAIATWVSNSTDCPNCANVKYWEIWNEFDRNNPNTAAVSWYARTGLSGACTLAPCPTPDQLMRMTEDAECIIKGTGTIDNYPNAGNHTPCGSLGSGWTVGIIGSSAEIVASSISDSGPAQATALECSLYCDSACTSWYGSSCVNTNGWPHLASDVDIIDYHFYAPINNPEDHATTHIRAVLQTQELKKPLWVGEGSWRDTLQTGQYWTDPYAQGGFAARWLASVWSQTAPVSGGCSWSTQVCQQAFWYGYDYDTQTANSGYTPSEVAPLYCPGAMAHGSCDNGGFSGQNLTAALIQPTATMYSTSVSWLTGASPSNSTFCSLAAGSSSIWHCDFTKGGTNYSMVWDNSYASAEKGQTTYCANTFPTNPYVCGNTPYTVPTTPVNFVGGEWQDLNPITFYNLGTTVPIGLNPILLIAP